MAVLGGADWIVLKVLSNFDDSVVLDVLIFLNMS